MGDVTRLVVDTDILLHDTFEDSEKHAEASELLDDADRVYMASIVLHEYLWLLLTKFKIDLDVVREKLEEYFGDTRFIYISENSEVFLKALEWMKEDSADPTMINDYIILVLAQRLGAVLATYDADLKEIAKRRGIQVTP
ncbi:PIN domain-containing protein [Infirmifilum sp. NZ]|uniref:PIN domain-containing protein n=1 Tax=Infirmifilum sp. NZ TaxID=2926850 RepID=UPI00279E1CE1|nr:PIN domain-containing protein [Infirmifilum sp. NZ]UNQ73998.1 PIN domain-containing protein [Infirmifilum sp. NZ]